MDKRLVKRHQRQVARAKARAKPSEPDLRTPEERAAAREASRARSNPRTDHRALYSTAPPSHAGRGAASATKVDVAS